MRLSGGVVVVSRGGKGTPRPRQRTVWTLTARGMAEAARQDRIDAVILAARQAEAAAAVSTADDPYAVLRLLHLAGER